MKAPKAGRIHWLQRNIHWIWLFAFLPLAVLVFSWGREIVDLRHAHGLGYSPDGSRLLIPDHFGIAVYDDGRWSKLPGPSHDYMGFTVTREFIFASGHAAGSRGGSNPLGLLRSADGGRSWAALGFQGETEFHVMGAAYGSNALYVYNTAPNALMPRAAIYRMRSEGTWRGATALGLEGEPRRLAVHPTEAQTIAVATRSGLFLSRDGGESFSPIAAGSRATAVLFAAEGDALLAGLYDSEPSLARIAVADGTRQRLPLPLLGRHEVAQIAQNPVRRMELALVSSERAVFVSVDAGRTWRRIARARGAL